MSLDTRFFFSILIQLIHKYMYDHLWFTSKFSHGLSLILSGNLLIFQWTICSILLCILSVKQSAAERQWGPFVKSLVWLDWISNPGLPPIRQTLYVTTRPPSWSILRFHQIFLQTFINWRKTLLGISNESFVWPKLIVSLLLPITIQPLLEGSTGGLVCEWVGIWYFSRSKCDCYTYINSWLLSMLFYSCKQYHIVLISEFELIIPLSTKTHLVLT